MTGWARATAPATVANVGAGFDVLGFALDAPVDEVRVRTSARPGVRLVEMTGACAGIPTDPGENVATVAAQAIWDLAPEAAVGLEMTIHKGIAPGSGIGSSAASSAAAAAATALALGLSTDPVDLLAAAIEGEAVASGAHHADNVAPSLAGGLVLVSKHRIVTALPMPDDLFCALIHPHRRVDTKSAREVLPRDVPFDDVVRQVGNCAGFIAGLYQDDDQLLSRGLTDLIAEPPRAHLTPGLDDVKSAAMEHGALGSGLSGSGPSIYALCRGRTQAETVADAMASAMRHSGTDTDRYVSGPNAPGARAWTES